jgi:hypothetical protein
VLNELLAHLRLTAAGSGEPEPFPREEAARALCDAYRMPSEPDRPRAVPPTLTAVTGARKTGPPWFGAACSHIRAGYRRLHIVYYRVQPDRMLPGAEPIPSIEEHARLVHTSLQTNDGSTRPEAVASKVSLPC